MSSDATTLPPGFGLAVTVLGCGSQAFLGRRLGIRAALNYSSALALLAVYVATGEHAFPDVWRALGFEQVREWTGALSYLWAICMLAAGVALASFELVRSNKKRAGPGQAQTHAKTGETLNVARRQFLQTAVAPVSTAAMCMLPAAVLGFGVITRKDFHINEVDLSFPELPNELHGLRLLQLSDIHMGVFYTAGDLARVVDASNSLRPDIAFVTGDLITTHHDPLDLCLSGLARLRASSGIWGCLGNHEKYSNVEAYTQARARELGIRFLRNEATTLSFGAGRLNLVGVDYERSGPYLERVAGLVDLSSFNLLLAHTPEVFPEAAEKGFDLSLSGHTHGGQVNLELMGTNLNIAEVHTPYTKGLYTLPTSMIYVNSGLGTIGAPIRIGAPPEITLIRLWRA
ncbi:MAG: metallophosphoesterase [Acidobacteriaceae bacterium]|nr:metallophosphoesterase [Acidobacteriaceae bacterium]